MDRARAFRRTITVENLSMGPSLFLRAGAPASKIAQQDQAIVDLPSGTYDSVVLFE